MNRETKSLGYITEWKVDVMNVNDNIVWVFILKDFLEELYLYISRTIKQKENGNTECILKVRDRYGPREARVVVFIEVRL